MDDGGHCGLYYMECRSPNLSSEWYGKHIIEFLNDATGQLLVQLHCGQALATANPYHPAIVAFKEAGALYFHVRKMVNFD